MKLHKIQNLILSVVRFVQNRADILAYGAIFVVITLSSIAPLSSGNKLNLNVDFFQYASRHEAVKKSLVEYHTFPLRSHWFGGGFPTLGDPEDPTLNPLVLLSVLFGAVMGLKLIGFLALLVGGLATYAYARYLLDYTRWGALFSGLIFGTSLFVPFRIADGNPNEVYAAFLPLCLLLIGLACRGRRVAIVILPFVFYTMLSDGKLTCLMTMFYIGVLCLLELVPSLNTFSPPPPTPPSPTPAEENPRINEVELSRRIDYRPLKFFLLALGLTSLIGMVRILPAQELIHSHGGISQMLSAHPKTYQPGDVFAYTFEQLWQETVGWKGRTGLVTIGWIPVILSVIALIAFWRSTLAWGINLLLFSWLILAHNAPIDLLKPLWNLPIFNAIYRPYKYFSFQIAFTFAIASGRCFALLKQLRPRWLEHLIALVLIAFGSGFLYPTMAKIQRKTYTYSYEPSADRSSIEGPQEVFFNVQGRNLNRSRTGPPRAVAYFNLFRNIGTIDWYTGIPIAENAIPKYFVNKNNNYISNPAYQGEAFFLAVEDAVDLKSALPTIEKQFADDSLVGLWHLDLVQKDVAKDSSGKGNNGRLVNMNRSSRAGTPARAALVKGKFGNALMFDGSNWIDVAPTPSLRLNESYTLSVWINASDMPKKIERFILDTDFPRSGSRYSLKLSYGSVRFKSAGTPYAEAGLKKNRWHNVVAVFDQKCLRLYVDGVEKAETPYTRKNTFKADVSLRIGGRTDPPGGECFKGLIDDVAIWNRALTPEEVMKIWSLGSTEQPLPPSTAKVAFRPNSIAVQANVQTPGILVINQNYHRDWHTNRGKLFNKNRLLALRLRETGSYTIRLRYIPRSFYTGLAISILSLAALSFICWAKRKGSLLLWSQNASSFTKRVSQAILWLIN